MANSQLYGKSYRIPPDILNNVKRAKILYPTSTGIKRANNLLGGVITFQGMERIKHDLEHFINDKTQYELAGGELMLQFVNRMLGSERAAVKRSDGVKQPILPNLNTDSKPESLKYELNEIKKEQIKNAICIIVNGDNKFLLLKRIEGENYWGSGQWGLVGGGVEKKDKNPEAAVQREIEEETGLHLSKFIKRFSIQRGSNETEYIFVSRYNGGGTDIALNDEHTAYGWFSFDELKELDTVPHLKEFIVMAFKKY